MASEAAVPGAAVWPFASLVSAASLAEFAASAPLAVEPGAAAALCAVGDGGSGGIVGR